MYSRRRGFSSCAFFASYSSDGLFYTVGNFYTWTISYKGNMKNKWQKNFLRKLFIVTGWRHVKCYYLNAKVLLILKPLLQNFQHHLLKIGIKCSIFKKLGDIFFSHEVNNVQSFICEILYVKYLIWWSFHTHLKFCLTLSWTSKVHP